MSSTYLNQILGRVWNDEMAACSSFPMKRLAIIGDDGEPMASPVLESIVHVYISEDVDNGHSKECRSFDVDLHFQDSVLGHDTQANGCAGAIASEHAAAKRGHHRFFFGPRKRGVRPHPPNPPWLRAWRECEARRVRHLPTINGVGRTSELRAAAPCASCAAVESRVLRTACKADVWAWARCEVAPASVEVTTRLCGCICGRGNGSGDRDRAWTGSLRLRLHVTAET